MNKKDSTKGEEIKQKLKKKSRKRIKDKKIQERESTSKRATGKKMFAVDTDEDVAEIAEKTKVAAKED
ncbi:hypothetical protein Tco_0333012 [Tanacetum coccineum]